MSDDLLLNTFNVNQFELVCKQRPLAAATVKRIQTDLIMMNFYNQLTQTRVKPLKKIDIPLPFHFKRSSKKLQIKDILIFS